MNTPTKQAHTPGPWQPYNADGGHINKWWRVKAGNTPICVVKEQEHSETELANARLIASAPQLLEALQEMLAETEKYGFNYPSGSYGTGRVVCNMARAAIQAATRS